MCFQTWEINRPNKILLELPGGKPKFFAVHACTYTLQNGG